MPELPEVEVAARNLARWARGRRVRAVVVRDRRTLEGGTGTGTGAPARAVPSRLVGARLTGVERIGKNLLLTFAASRGKAARTTGVWSHLGMTGKWVRRAAADAETAPRFSRLRLDFVGGPTLHFVDMRLFGFFRLVPGADFARVPAIAALGPDPLRQGIDTDRLAGRFARIDKPIKLAIMDQALIPGVGNIQASEGLFRAAIDPRRPASSLAAREIKRLARALLASFHHTLDTFAADGVLATAGRLHEEDIAYVEEPGTRNPFRVYDRAGVRCPRCRRGVITRIVQGGRSTYFCPACQR